MESVAYIRSGPMAMSPDLGSVHLDRGEDEPEYLGFVGDADNCPDGLEEDWAVLLEWWESSGRYADACLATARRSYYYGIDPARMN